MKGFHTGERSEAGRSDIPKLFISLLEHQFRKLKWGNRYGIYIDGIRLTHLRFADDILLVVTSAKEL